MSEISAYTDGSCNAALRIGAWASFIITGSEKKVLKGHAVDTTHHRMELTAVVRTLEYMAKNKPSGLSLTLYTDSQYVTGLLDRRQKITRSGFITKNKKTLANADLIKRFFVLGDAVPVSIVKVKAHQKKSAAEQVNGEVDKLCRKMVRSLARERGSENK